METLLGLYQIFLQDLIFKSKLQKWLIIKYFNFFNSPLQVIYFFCLHFLTKKNDVRKVVHNLLYFCKSRKSNQPRPGTVIKLNFQTKDKFFVNTYVSVKRSKNGDSFY